MSSSAQHVDWVSRVLGVTVAGQPKPPTGEKGSATPPEPFQVFVKSLDDVTLTLDLPSGPKTTLGELRGMIEDRTGLSLDHHSLMIGTKPFRYEHAKLAVAEYGLQRNQTLSLQGSLKGGFGERAAMADTIQRGIVHGNVLGEIQETSGVSKAKVGFCRRMLDPQLKEGKEFENRLLEKLKKALPRDVTLPELQNWIVKNKPFVSAITSSHLQAGNCGEYADVAYSSLVSNTQSQFVYKAAMIKTPEHSYDHVFVITCPRDYGNDVVKLYNDNEAMVVDPWWDSTICTFKRFADGNNPYSEKVDPKKNLQIQNRTAATGKPPVSKGFESAIKAAVDELSGMYKKDLEQRAQQIGKNVEELAKALQEVENCKRAAKEAQEKLSDPNASTDFDEWDKAQQAHAQAQKKLAEARKVLGNPFGASGEIWNRTRIKDVREDDELFRTFDQALKSGGNKQLEVAMAKLDPDEFFDYLFARDEAVIKQVLGSQRFQVYFRKNCDTLTDDDFFKLCKKMNVDDRNDILKDQRLAQRYVICELAEQSPFVSADIFLSPDLERRLSDALNT